MSMSPRLRLISVLGTTAALVVAATVWILLACQKPAEQPTAAASHSAPVAGKVTKRIDAHAHLQVGALAQLLGLMKQYKFQHIVDLSGGIPGHGLEHHLAQAQQSDGRISVFMTIPGRVLQTANYGPQIVALLEQAKGMGARGFKVPKGLGLGYVNSRDELIPVDDPGLDVVFEACGRLGFPVSIHTADPKAFWLPVDKNNERLQELGSHPSWSFYGKPIPSWSALLDQLERRVARHPKTTFVSVHFGNAAEEPERVAQMLRKYPNLYIDTAARVPEFGRHPPAQMRRFFVEFQDRILYGTDLGVGEAPLDLVLGSGGDDYPTQALVDRFFSSTYRYFETPDLSFENPTPIQGNWTISGIELPKEVLEKVYFRNAMRVMGIAEP